MRTGGLSIAAEGDTAKVTPPYDIVERTALFADRCIQVALALPDNGVAWELQKQLARSGASVGANLAERKGVLSKPEFNHKVSVSLREAHETVYWLERIVRADMIPEQQLRPLLNEANEIVSILTVMLKNARRNQ